MEEELVKKSRPNHQNLDDVRFTQIAEFDAKVRKEFSGLICTSLASRDSMAGKSVLITLILDDLNNPILDQQTDTIRLKAADIAYSSTVEIKCEIVLASEVWRLLKERREEMMDLLRSSLVVSDNGFFRPIQDLLVTGKVRPSKESTDVYFVKAERSMKTSSENVRKAVIDLYWAVTDSAHAAVMVAGITPPSPSHLAEVLKQELISRNLVHKRCGTIIENIYNLAKAIMHKERYEVTGREFDSLVADADFFVKEMDDFVKEHTK